MLTEIAIYADRKTRKEYFCNNCNFINNLCFTG